jgi:hypothetical protein
VARIRSIKPEFFLSEDVAALPLRARLLWIGLWTHCDDAGRTKDNARLIKGAVWPLDNVSLADIEDDLATLADHGRIVRYEVGGRRYLEVTNWSEHQKINNPSKPKHPARLSTGGPYVSPNGALPEPYHEEGKGKEGKGGDARARASPPPRHCAKHTDSPTSDPCGPCADARRAHEQWQADRNAAVRTMPACPTHRGQLAHNCASCRADQLAADA